MDISLASEMASPPLNVDMNKQASSLGELKHNVPLQGTPRGRLEGLIQDCFSHTFEVYFLGS
jgi:hypothetical protein